MAEYSKEFSGMKGLAAKELNEMINGIKNGTIKMSGNEPKMSYRALRSLLLSEDKVHQHLVEDFLSGKTTPEQFKNKIRTNIETKQPGKVRVIDTDRIHHKTPLEFGEILSQLSETELREFLTQQYEQKGRTYGDTDQNTRGSSFDERSHTGARPKASKSKIVYPNQLGEDGVRKASAHPRGTRDKLYQIPDRPTTAKEAAAIADPLLQQADKDFNLGVKADSTRRSVVNNRLQQQGITVKGEDVFSSTASDELLQRARPTLKTPELQIEAAQAFKKPKPTFLNGQAMFNSIIPWFDYLGPLDQATGGHVESTIDKGVNVVRESLGFEPNPVGHHEVKDPITNFGHGVARRIWDVGNMLSNQTNPYPAEIK